MRNIPGDRRRVAGATLVGVAVLVAVAAVLATRSGPQAKYTPENIPLGTMSAMSAQGIASLLVPDPEGDWCREEVTSHWEDGNELRTLEHGLSRDDEIPEEVLALVEERSRMQRSEFGLQAIQGHRILFGWAGRRQMDSWERHGALVLDVRYVTGAGSSEERWEIWDSGPVYHC